MDKLIDDLIKLAFAEDIGDGDHTTLCCIPETAMGKSQLIIKEDGVLAGVEMAKRIFHDFDPELKMTVFIQDGNREVSQQQYFPQASGAEQTAGGQPRERD